MTLTALKKPLAPILYVVLVLGFLLSPAVAQSGVGISPPRVELNVGDGGQISQTVEVDNPSSTSNLSVGVSISDALLGSDSNILWVPAGSHGNSLAPWLEVNPLQFELNPGERRSITYTVSVPTGTVDGTYWAVLFFESSPAAESGPEAQEGVGVISRVRVGHVIYVTVGQPVQDGSIVGMRYVPASSNGSISVNFQNSGTGVLRLNGRVELRDASGALLRTLTITDQVSFPNATHELGFDLGEPLATGAYTALAVMDFGASRVILGEATVTVP